jgi:superfamily I DNA/RNA helicase
MAFYKKAPISNEKKIRFIPPSGWNEQFKAVFDFIENGSGNGAIEAVAGSGKTTAIIESIIRLTEKEPNKKILFVAYNTSIKEEAESRLSGYNVKISTCHGLGYQAIRNSNYSDGYQFDLGGTFADHMVKLASNEIGSLKEHEEARANLLDLVSKAKCSLKSSIEDLIELIAKHEIDTCGYDNNRFAKYAQNILTSTRDNLFYSTSEYKGKKTTKVSITFDDQIWLPIVKNMDVEKYDYVFVDEAQDLSEARRVLISKAIRNNGRIFIFFDKFQAIYQFSGADIESASLLIEQFACKTLPLSFSWRCGKLIINKAQELNPIIEAPDSAIDGEINNVKLENICDCVNNGDAILSRKNSNLIKLFFRLAKEQKKVKFIGKDYGRMLYMRISQWRAKDPNLTADKIVILNDEWLKDKKTITTRHKDEYETVLSLTFDLNSKSNSTKSVDEILERCLMFSPDENKNDNTDSYITLSSVHRFKGLERNRVFLLQESFSNDSQEELNLQYVAITRAKKSLNFVS